MTVSTGPKAIDHFIAINQVLVGKGGSIAALDDGALRRYFNETIKNTDRQVHDAIGVGMSKHAAELESLIIEYAKNWNDKIQPEFISKFEALFDKLNEDLKNDSQWKDFWDNVSPKPENVEHAQERILMAYRFKMFQMITGKLKVEKTPQLDGDKQPVLKDGKPVMVPAYEIKKVASLDIVLQKLNGAYDRRNKTGKSLEEQFKDEYRNESAPGYINDINMMLGVAFKMQKEGKSPEEIKEYLKVEREKIQQEIVKKDKYAIHVGPEKAKELFDELFSLEKLTAKVEGYKKVSEDLGYDVNAKIRLLIGCKETIDQEKYAKLSPEAVTQTSDIPKVLTSKQQNLIDDYINMLKSKVYYKGYENHKIDDIFVPFNEERFKALEQEVNRLIEGNPLVQANRDGLLKNDLLESAQQGNYAKFKEMVQIGPGISLTTEIAGTESLLDIAKRTFPEDKYKEIVELAKENASKLDLSNPTQYAMIKTYAKDVFVLEYFDFKELLAKTEKLDGAELVTGAKKILDDYILNLNEQVVALNLDGQGTPASIVELRDQLREYKEKSQSNTLTQEDAQKIVQLCKDLENKYEGYLVRKGGQLPNEVSRGIISSKYPVHEFILMKGNYKEGQGSDRNYVWNAIKKHADFNGKNLDGVTPLELAARTQSKEMVTKVLDGGAKTTEYKRGFLTRVGDAFKGFPKNLKHFAEAPPRTIKEIHAISGKTFNPETIVNRIIESEKGKAPPQQEDAQKVTEPKQVAPKGEVREPEKPPVGPTITPEVNVTPTVPTVTSDVTASSVSHLTSKLDATHDMVQSKSEQPKPLIGEHREPKPIILSKPEKPPRQQSTTPQPTTPQIQEKSEMTFAEFAQKWMDEIKNQNPNIDSTEPRARSGIDFRGNKVVDGMMLKQAYSVLKELKDVKGDDKELMKQFKEQLASNTKDVFGKDKMSEPVKKMMSDMQQGTPPPKEESTKKLTAG